MPLNDVDYADAITYARTGDAQTLGVSGDIETVAEDVPVITYTAAGSALGHEMYGEVEQLLANTSDPDYWGANLTNVTQTADAGAAPDGTTTAALMTENSSLGSHYLGRNAGMGVDAGSNRAVSLFVKANGRTRLLLTLFDFSALTNYVRLTVNLTAVTATTSVGGNGVAVHGGIETYPNGWYRITLIGTPNPSSVGNLYARLEMQNDSGVSNYTGDGTSGLYHWGWNLHNGRCMMPFVATTTAPKTRGADLVSVNNLASTFGATQGTFYIRFVVPHAAPSDADRTLLHMDDGTTDESYDIKIVSGGTNVSAVVRAGGSEVANIVAGSITPGSLATVAFSYATDAFRISLNGAAAVSDTSGAVPTGLTALYLGASDDAGADPLNGVIRKVERRRIAMNAADLAVYSAS